MQTPEQWIRFVSAFVHELRTPLASFRMLADLLAEAPQAHLGTPKTPEAEKRIAREAWKRYREARARDAVEVMED